MKRKPDRFLVINPFGIGDALFTTPLLAELARAFPGCRIGYLCNRAEPVLRYHPLVGRTFTYERKDYQQELKKSLLSGLRKYNTFISSLRRERYDCSIDLSLSAPFSLFALLAGIPLRIGLDYKGRGRFLNRKVRIDGFNSKHVADHYLDVLTLLGVTPARDGKLEVFTGPAQKEWAAGYAARLGRPLIGIAPCGGEAFGKDAPVKRWPAENFSALVGRLAARFPSGKILVFAGPGEEAAEAGRIIAASGAPHRCEAVTGQPLENALALIERCDCFIGNDTGLVRCAEALGKSAVLIFGIADERVYGPYGENLARVALLKKDLPCRPCYRNFRLPRCEHGRECLTGISVDEVFGAATRILGGG